MTSRRSGTWIVPRTLVISDANILLDMESGGLLQPMFRLDLRFAIPDVLLLTELKRESTRLRGLGLVAKEVGSEGVDYIQALSATAGRLGVGRMDLFALALARQEGCMLLSGDARLRTLAEKELGQKLRQRAVIFHERGRRTELVFVG